MYLLLICSYWLARLNVSIALAQLAAAGFPGYAIYLCFQGHVLEGEEERDRGPEWVSSRFREEVEILRGPVLP